MKVLITGGAGFLGHRLARRLLAHGSLCGEPIDELVLVDRVAPDAFDRRVTPRAADIGDPALMRDAVDGAAVIFHLAAIVSGQAEEDFDLGMRVNLDALRLLLDLARAGGACPRFVQTSSVAVYGGTLPDLVTDDTPLRPSSSYGMQKAVGELLVGDYSRRGFVDGRVLRLPTISVRPGKPNRAASSFASGIIREPLNGEPAICPVPLDTRLWLMSPRAAIEAIVAGAELAGDALGSVRSINLPGISVRVAEMIATLEKIGGADAVARIVHAPDPAIETIVGSWPAAWDTGRAAKLGFRGDQDFEAIVRAYVEDDAGSGQMSDPDKPKVAVIGLGSMGLGMARSLLRAGFPVAGCDTVAAARDAFDAAGGKSFGTAAEAAAGADIVFSVVVNAAQTEQILFGADGLVDAMAADGLVLSCATMDPALARGFAARVADRGRLYLDAPISGGAVRAAEGQLTVMASGAADAFARADAVLDAVAAKIFRLGDAAGQGSAFKMVNQLLAGVHIAVASEAMVFAAAQGLDLAQVYDVITASAGNSWMFENRMPHVLEGDYRPASAIDIFVKDLGIVDDMARAARSPTPIAAAALHMYLAASGMGMGRDDDASVARVYAALANQTLPAGRDR